MASHSSISLCELPLFPLPEVVLFPDRPLPLYIFEPRYKLMVNTVLQGDKRFGVLLWNPQSTRSVRVGCSAEITDVVKLDDGRMNLMTIGGERFKVVEFIRDKPYLMGKVEWFEDEPSDLETALLAAQVRETLNQVVRLSSKLARREVALPEDLPGSATDLSFWIGSLFFGSANGRQELLEMNSTHYRLSKEHEVLSALMNELAARAAIEDAFS